MCFLTYVKYGEHSDGAGYLEKVYPFRVAEGKDEDDGAERHREVSAQVPHVAEVVAVNGSKSPEMVIFKCSTSDNYLFFVDSVYIRTCQTGLR